MNESATGGEVHVVSIKLLLIVWVALMFGTWLTVTVTYFDFDGFNLWIGVAIATAKATLVGLYYMHLRWDKRFNAFVFISAFVVLSLMIGLSLMDTAENQPVMIPDYGRPVPAASAS